MPRIAVTGHMNLSSTTESIVYDAIRVELDKHARAGKLTGISCIARGSDSIFAQAVLDSGGELEVVLPSADYREKKVRSDDVSRFDSLLSRATDVTIASDGTADRAAYERANCMLLDSSDVLFAVWDGARGGNGGTASVVELAEVRDHPVEVIWPMGAERG